MSLSQLGWFTNPLPLRGIATELVVLALIIYTPWDNSIFGTSPLPAWIFGPLAMGALAPLLAEEGRKIIVNRFKKSRASYHRALDESLPRSHLEIVPKTVSLF